MADVACDAAENTAPKQRGRPFRPGASGNPRGRPKGARNRATVTDVDEGQDNYEDIFGGYAEALKKIQSAVS